MDAATLQMMPVAVIGYLFGRAAFREVVGDARGEPGSGKLFSLWMQVSTPSCEAVLLILFSNTLSRQRGLCWCFLLVFAKNWQLIRLANILATTLEKNSTLRVAKTIADLIH